MTSENIERLKEIQRKIERDAQTVTTRDDLIRLRAFWGDIQQIIVSEENGTIGS